MLEQRKEIENQLAIESDGRQRSKLDSKLKALDDAVERGDITEGQAADEKLRLELGIPGSQSPLFKKKDESDFFSELLSERGEAPDVPSEQKNSAKLLQFVSSGATSTEDRVEIKRVLSKGDPAEIKIVLDLVEAKESTRKKDARNPTAIIDRLGKSLREKERSSFRPPSTFSQSMGSFR